MFKRIIRIFFWIASFVGSVAISETDLEPALVLNQPLTLQQAIDLVLQRNPDLHIATERIAIAEAQANESLAAFYPQLKARMAYEYSDNPSRTFGMIVSQGRFTQQDFVNINNPEGTTEFRPEITGTISLFNGGKDYHRNKLAELGIEVSELQFLAIKNDLLQAVTDSFYAFLVAKENYQIALRAIDAITQELQHTQIRLQGGSALKSDVLSLQVRLSGARGAEITANNVTETARTLLRTLLDLSPHSPVEIELLGNSILPVVTVDYAELISRAEVSRPEFQIAAKQVEIQQRQVQIAQGDYLPRLDGYVNYGMNSKNFEFSGNRDNVTAGVALEMELFSGFSTQQKVRKQQRKLVAVIAQQHKVKLQIHQQVKNAYLMLHEALQRYKVTEVAKHASKEALRLVTEQHQAGMVTVTRFIEAQVARDQAHARFAAALYDALRAEAALTRATGGWHSVAVD